MDKYNNADIAWCQEEHKNQGGWTYVQPRFQTAIGGYDTRISYVGREVLNKIYVSLFRNKRFMLDEMT